MLRKRTDGDTTETSDQRGDRVFQSKTFMPSSPAEDGAAYYGVVPPYPTSELENFFLNQLNFDNISLLIKKSEQLAEERVPPVTKATNDKKFPFEKPFHKMFSRNGALGPQKMLNSQKREKAAAKSFSQVVKAPETQQRNPHSSPKATGAPLALQARISKTKICIHNLSGNCTRGTACTFAHSLEELREPPNLLKTRFCNSYIATGTCSKGANCRFAHGEAELRTAPELYKTNLCPYWRPSASSSGERTAAGGCPAGASCRWAHGIQELPWKPASRSLCVPFAPSTAAPLSEGVQTAASILQKLRRTTLDDEFLPSNLSYLYPPEQRATAGQLGSPLLQPLCTPPNCFRRQEPSLSNGQSNWNQEDEKKVHKDEAYAMQCNNLNTPASLNVKFQQRTGTLPPRDVRERQKSATVSTRADENEEITVHSPSPVLAEPTDGVNQKQVPTAYSAEQFVEWILSSVFTQE